jgi:putative DNA primase/helicase
VINSSLNAGASSHCTIDAGGWAINYDNPSSSYDLLPTAKEYASRGWQVLPLFGVLGSHCTCSTEPCGCIGKHPLTWDGLKSATTDAEQIAFWWTCHHTLNVGVATGECSGIFVLDIDINSAKHGDVSLSQLEAQHSPLPPTVEAITGSGGRHLIFKHPGFTVANKQNSGSLGHGIDVRGDGGYIVAPGSRHKSGGVYQWKAGHSPDDLSPAEAPAWLIGLLQSGGQREVADPADASVADPNPKTAASDNSADTRALLEAARAYLSKCEPAITGDGGDGHTFSVAGHLDAFQLPDGTKLSIDQITAVMMEEWNGTCSPPWTRSELRKKVESGVKNGTPRPPKIVERVQKLPPGSPASFECSDLGNAERFVRDHGQDVHYTSGYGWMFWNGTHWEADQTREIDRKAKDTVRRIAIEAASLGSDVKRSEVLKWAITSQSLKHLEAMVKLAVSEPGVIIKGEQLNTDPMLLNCLNGTIDLRTGKLRQHQREDLISKVCPVIYDENAPCPEWMKFLGLITCGDVQTQEYLQRALGYSVTGDTSEQCLFFLYGHGKNGKTTFMNTISSLLGNDTGYAGKASADSLMVSKHERTIRNDLARLQGHRFILPSELEQSKRWDESTIKEMTGGDRIKACFKYKEEFEFNPVWKLWCYGNHKPDVMGTDMGFWRRMKLVPFTAEIPESVRISQTKIAAMLKAEWGGILAWIVKGCLEWQRRGNKVESCPVVDEATTEYRRESDAIGQFAIERLDVHSDSARLEHKKVYQHYRDWAEEEGIKFPLASRQLSKQMKQRGYKDSGCTKQLIWAGICLTKTQFGQSRTNRP